MPRKAMKQQHFPLARIHLMSGERPVLLDRLVTASDQPAREVAWDRLIEEHSDLLLRVARSLGGDHDSVMDRYAKILEQLRREDFRKLRAYTPDDNARFTTWLVVVARRLCLDQVRQRYGRLRGSGADDRGAVQVRRRLTDLVAHAFDLHEVPDPSVAHPADRLAVRHSTDRLHAALAALDDGDRLLLKLRYEDDLPAREIAVLMHLPTLFHVYRRVNALLASLRRSLESDGVEDAGG